VLFVNLPTSVLLWYRENTVVSGILQYHGSYVITYYYICDKNRQHLLSTFYGMPKWTKSQIPYEDNDFKSRMPCHSISSCANIFSQFDWCTCSLNLSCAHNVSQFIVTLAHQIGLNPPLTEALSAYKVSHLQTFWKGVVIIYPISSLY